jgi:predicted phosphodiesterase
VRLGLISDVHGNRIALEAVVADGVQQGVDTWWVLGDLVAIGAEPIPTLELLADLPGVRFVRGNTDRYVMTGKRPSPHRADVERDPSLQGLFDAVEASFSWTRAHVERAGWSDMLASLPATQRLDLADGTRLLGVHASPGSDDGPGITPEIADADLERLLENSDADIVCSGHTHRPTNRRIGGVRAVNLGSVSNPMTADLRATYVVIDDDRHGHRLAHRRVGYDHDAVLQRCEQSDHPEAAYIASFQRGERARYAAVRPGAPDFDS